MVHQNTSQIHEQNLIEVTCEFHIEPHVVVQETPNRTLCVTYYLDKDEFGRKPTVILTVNHVICTKRKQYQIIVRKTGVGVEKYATQLL